MTARLLAQLGRDERLGDLDELAFGERECADARVSRDRREPDSLEQLVGELAELTPPDPAPPRAALAGAGPGEVFGAEEQVLVHAQVLDERLFLHHDRHAERGELAGVTERSRVAVDRHLTSVGADRAADDADQGRLAGAVLTDQPDDLADVDAEGDVVQRLHRSPVLARPGDGQAALSPRLRRRSGDRRRGP